MTKRPKAIELWFLCAICAVSVFMIYESAIVLWKSSWIDVGAAFSIFWILFVGVVASIRVLGIISLKTTAALAGFVLLLVLAIKIGTHLGMWP